MREGRHLSDYNGGIPYGEQQEALYAKGRTKPGKIVTNARGNSYSSQHMWGVAFDIAINDGKKLYDGILINKAAKMAKSDKVGLGWGDDWKSFPDAPHFYLKMGEYHGRVKKTVRYTSKV